jgi:glutamate/tyrosine decarboxylase-like PLP-dependent enzyme
MIDTESIHLLEEAMDHLGRGFESLPVTGTAPDEKTTARMRAVLEETAARLHDNFPYQHPLYAGQMLKPPHAVARLAYALAMIINPNNHALDGGRASSAMEKECVAELAGMMGWDEHLGHLTGGGTMANLEALWVASVLSPGRKVVASELAHYTHSRMCDVLGTDFEALPVDARGRLDVDALETALERHPVAVVVASLGTTGCGSVDPLHRIVALREKHPFRIHVDAAYGGYYRLAGNLTDDAPAAFDAITEADSIVIDPHKHGLQPYGCGCVLFRDPAVGSIYKHDSPYTYFSSDELHLGEISLECSRAGAAAVALWATMKMFPLARGGEFARGLESCRDAALDLHGRLEADPRFLTAVPPDLDIVIFAPRANKLSKVSEKSRRLFEAAAKQNLHLALAEFPTSLVEPYWFGVELDRPTVTCVRSVLMKPEHRDWIDRIWAILDALGDEA